MLFRQIADPKLAQYAYLLGCQRTKEALLIDPERDIDRYVEAAAGEGLRITAVAETHIHADFLSGAREFAERYGVRLYLSAEGEAEGWGSAWAKDAGYDVTFLRHGDRFRAGRVVLEAVHTPGHTPEHLAFLVTDEGSGATTPLGIVTGDFVFVGDLGRPDLLEQAAGLHGAQEPSARRLYHALPTFLGLDEHLQVWPGHGAGSACGKALGAVPQTTVGYEKRYNASLAAAEAGEDAFVEAILSGQPEPPLYFARMKRLNRDGVPLLGALPRPRRLTPDDLGLLPNDHVVIDTRADREAFMAHHLPGALYAPLDKSFPTSVGSLVEDAASALVLIVDEAHVEEAVRNLVRIGYDRIEAYATPDAFATYLHEGGETASIETISFEALARRRTEPGAHVIDVRTATEYREGHVPGAVNASHTRLPVYARERLPEAGTLLVHCQTGARSAVAAAYLARLGRTVAYVDGTFPTYAASHPVESEPTVAA